MKLRRLAISWLGGMLCVLAVAEAAPLSRDEVPAPLAPWVDWVLRGHESEGCPFSVTSPDERRCVWPSRLALELDDSGGRFRQEVLVAARSWLPLPGDGLRWPQEVTVDGKAAAVIEQNGAPSVELEAGAHVVAGRLAWSTLPELLPIPPSTGLVSLEIRGQGVPFPNRDPASQLWLGRRTVESGEESRLDVVVHRHLSDDVPLIVTTQVKLLVAGKNREVLLAKALPPDLVPMSLESPLPARVEPDGRIRVQVRPGTWFLTLVARASGPVAKLSLPEIDGPWDPEEVWVFEARPDLRLVTIEGVAAIDPQQTELPDHWRSLPAYPMKPGSVLELIERRRGDAEPAPDRLSLTRTLWLDFDGGGFTIRDQLSGTMSQSWRLEMQTPTALGRVAIGGQDQFITRHGESGMSGVEVRQDALVAEADSRLDERPGDLPAVGWNHDFQQVSALLQLPPGWKLFHASGADDVSETWIGRWTLLDLFVVLLLSLAIGAVWGRAWGALALAALTLVYPENGASAPTWIALVALQALVVALPEGRAQRVLSTARFAVLVVLVLTALSFMIQQARIGLYPALEQPYTEVSQGTMGGGAANVAMAPPPPMPLATPPAGVSEQAYDMAERVESRVLRGRSAPRKSASMLAYAAQDRLTAIDPNAQITTGPGVPRWSWLPVSISWRGPVDRGQTFRLYLLSPSMNFLLAWLRIGLLAALVYCVLRVRPTLTLPGRTPAAAAAAVLLALLGAPSAVAAEFPPQSMLDDLRGRLLERPECTPACAALPRLFLEAGTDRLSLRLEVDAAAEVAIPLPGGDRHWLPERVAIDGVSAGGLALGDGGQLWLTVPRGRHQVVLEGPLPKRDTVDLPFALPARHAEARATGWAIDGIAADGEVQGTITLVRERAAGEQKPDVLEPAPLPPFVQIERVIRLGLSREVVTRVVRMTPAGTPVVLEVPLLAGESPTTSDIRVDKGKAIVELAPQAAEIAWTSILEASDSIELRAPESSSWVETWILDAAPMWHVEPSGIPMRHRGAEGGTRIREWRPWPGEALTIAVTRPEGVPGPTLTIDRAALVTRPGKRTTDATLELEVRSSRGAEHAVTLPEGSELQTVTVDGAVQPIRQEERKVTLPIHPGSQTITLAWRESRGVGSRVRTSSVDLGAPSVNDDVRLEMPPDRWILFVGGGRLGPAVLFWSVLVIVALVAVALARLGWTPLGVVSWFLLGIGLTQVTVSAAAIVAGWLLALGWRRREGAALGDGQFDLVQVALVAWTVAAAVSLFSAIEQGLLGTPDMQILGNGSYAGMLHWTFDRSAAEMPTAWAISVPLFVYRLAMLAWALWIARALLGWIRWGWDAFSTGGLWRKGGLRPQVRRSAKVPEAANVPKV